MVVVLRNSRIFDYFFSYSNFYGKIQKTKNEKIYNLTRMLIPDPPAPYDAVVSVAAFVTCVVIVVGTWSCWWRGETSRVPWFVVAVVSKIRTRISSRSTKDATVLDDNGDTATYDDPYDSISKCTEHKESIVLIVVMYLDVAATIRLLTFVLVCVAGYYLLPVSS